jgi:hypothetical protein
MAETISEATLNEWRGKHHSIYEFQVGDKKAYFRTPTLKEMDAASEQKTNMKYNQTLAKTCFLGGDKEVLDDERYFMSLIPKLDKLVKEFDVEVKKL